MKGLPPLPLRWRIEAALANCWHRLTRNAALAKRGLKCRLALALPQMYAAPTLVARSGMIAP